MKVKTKLADNLRILRHRHKYTQEEVATFLWIPRPRYERWESGTEPPLSKLLEIATFYGVTIEHLLTELPNPTFLTPQ